MRAEIIAVGTELLLGDILDTNSQWISQELRQIGVDVLHRVTVGDNQQRIAEAIAVALDRSDAVIICGGLGPTHDDLTRESIASATGRALELVPEIETWLRSLFARLGREMAEENLRQAYQPMGAEPIRNDLGTAPGVSLSLNGKRIYAVPGVPSEMKPMMKNHVLAELALESGMTLVTRTMKITGMGESDVAKVLRDLISRLDKEGTPKISMLFSLGEVRVRITAKAASNEQAVAAIAPVEEEVAELFGTFLFAREDVSLEEVTARALRDRGLRLAVAESLTGGLVTAGLIDAPGASEFLQASYVTYSTSSKARDLGIEEAFLQKFGAVSKECAEAMANGARKKAGSDLGLSATGEAGPDAKEAESGTVFIALAHPSGVLSRKIILPGDRSAIRIRAAKAAVNLLRLWLMEKLD